MKDFSFEPGSHFALRTVFLWKIHSNQNETECLKGIVHSLDFLGILGNYVSGAQIPNRKILVTKLSETIQLLVFTSNQKMGRKNLEHQYSKNQMK